MVLVPPPRTPSVAVARVLRDLGLTQGPGKDFRVDGEYRGGERIGTWVLVLTRHADETTPPAPTTSKPASRTARSPSTYRCTTRASPPAHDHRQPRRARTAGASARYRPGGRPRGGGAAGTGEDPKERALQRKQAKALGWSTGQADLMAAAAAGRLYRYPNGSLRDVATPGHPGRTVADRRLHQLATVGLVAEGEPDSTGRHPVRVTADGRRRADGVGSGGARSLGRRRKRRSGRCGPWSAASRPSGGPARRRPTRRRGASTPRRSPRRPSGSGNGTTARSGCGRRGRGWRTSATLASGVPAGWVPTDEEAAGTAWTRRWWRAAGGRGRPAAAADAALAARASRTSCRRWRR